jgi:hypothetical protein
MVRRSDGATGGGSDRAARLLDRLKDNLELTQDQVLAVQAAVDKAVAAVRAERNAGTEVDGRSGFGGQLEKALRKVLTPEQLVRYQEMRQDRRRQRRFAQVWVLEGDGKLAPRHVQLGIGDHAVTEIVDGALQPGEEVVTRVRDTRG